MGKEVEKDGGVLTYVPASFKQARRLLRNFYHSIKSENSERYVLMDRVKLNGF